MGADDLDLVLALERELQTPACRQDRGRLEELLAPEFVEIGASGTRWSRAEIIESLLDEDAGTIVVRGISARAIAEDVVLVAWSSEREGRRALRTSLWRREPSGWRLTHHQGTPTA